MRNIIDNKVVYIVPTGAHKTIYLEDGLIKPLENLGVNVWVMPTDMARRIIPEYDSFKQKYNVKEDFSKQMSCMIPKEEVVVVAPCTFNTFNKIANGIADNYPLSIVHNAIGKGIKVIIAPAMDYYLWKNFTIRESLKRIQSQPNIFIVYPEVIYDENGKISKISMAPYQKIVDTIVREFITIKYEHLKMDGEIEDIREMYYPVFKQYGDILGREGFVTKKAGFLAAKTSKGIITTATTAEVGNLYPEDLTLVVGVKDKKVFWKGNKAPTSEFPIVFEIFSEFHQTIIIHGHCNKITYNSKKNKYATDNYMSYGEWNTIDKIRGKLIKFNGFAIMKLHGEIVLGKSFEETYQKYKEMSL